jgi:hypothetical protein
VVGSAFGLGLCLVWTVTFAGLRFWVRVVFFARGLARPLVEVAALASAEVLDVSR